MNPLDEFVGLEEFSLILALESGAVHLKRLFLAFYDLLPALSLQHALGSRGDEAHPEEVHHQLYLEAHVSVALHHEAVTEHPELLLDERLERRQVQRCVHLRVRDLVQRDLRVLQVYLRVFLQPEKRKLELPGQKLKHLQGVQQLQTASHAKLIHHTNLIPFEVDQSTVLIFLHVVILHGLQLCTYFVWL